MTLGWDDLGEPAPGWYEFSWRIGDHQIGLPVIVTPEQLIPVHPRGPYGIELESCTGGGDHVSIYHVFPAVAARAAGVAEDSPVYLLRVGEYRMEGDIPLATRKELLAEYHRTAGGRSIPCPGAGGWSR